MSLPGRVGFPTVEFPIDDSYSVVLVELEVRLDLSLEGEAEFRFGDGNALGATFNRVYQWTLVRAP